MSPTDSTPPNASAAETAAHVNPQPAPQTILPPAKKQKSPVPGSLILLGLVFAMGAGGSVVLMPKLYQLGLLPSPVMVKEPVAQLSPAATVNAIATNKNEQTEISDALEQRLAKLESRLTETSIAATTDPVALQNRLAEFEEKLATLDSLNKAVADTSQYVAQIDTLRRQIGELQDAIKAQTVVGGSVNGLSASIAALTATTNGLTGAFAVEQDRLDRLSRAVATDARSSRDEEIVLLALGNLRVALAKSAPFTAELETLEILARHDSELKELIAPLQNLSASGVPTIETLTDMLENRADRIVRAALKGEGDTPNWRQRVAYQLGGLFTIRTLKPQQSGSDDLGTLDVMDTGTAEIFPADLVSIALKALRSEQDLGLAVATLGKLSGNAGTQTQIWLKEASKRIEADRVSDELQVYALQTMEARDSAAAEAERVAGVRRAAQQDALDEAAARLNPEVAAEQEAAQTASPEPAAAPETAPETAPEATAPIPAAETETPPAAIIETPQSPSENLPVEMVPQVPEAEHAAPDHASPEHAAPEHATPDHTP